MTSARHKPTTLDDLIPLVGDAIEHAQSLQETATNAVKGIGTAAGSVETAVANLEKAKLALAASIAAETKKQVKAAMDDSAVTLGAALTLAQSAATQALTDVTTASNDASSALRDAAYKLEAMKRRYLVQGLVIGLLIGGLLAGAGVWAYLANRDLNTVVTWIKDARTR